MRRTPGAVSAITCAARSPPPPGMRTSSRARSGCVFITLAIAASASLATATTSNAGSSLMIAVSVSRTRSSSSATSTRILAGGSSGSGVDFTKRTRIYLPVSWVPQSREVTPFLAAEKTYRRLVLGAGMCVQLARDAGVTGTARFSGHGTKCSSTKLKPPVQCSHTFVSSSPMLYWPDDE